MLELLSRKQKRVIEDPSFTKFLFTDARMSVVWLVIRLWLGWEWLEAGWHKIGAEGWTSTGASIQGYWERVIIVPESGRAAIAFDWYRSFIQYLLDNEAYVLFGKLIAYGEFLVGIGLIIGAFVGVAAFFGALMNFNFMMAGSASTNPVLFILAILLILAWKTAGFIGADYFLLNWIGTPWKRNQFVEEADDNHQRLPAGAGD
ncbi:MAG: DoxX family membrane protein [Anaerolineae bacterium]|nr:DoxX family membrane protein [Anaerolineae bacterium]MDQ7036776.1 DoxX family membrane protein [Anaerolineae bacterium]